MLEKVVTLHGIFRTSRSLQGLAGYLEKSGYDALNVDYPSTRHDVETLCDLLHPKIAAFVSDHRCKTHLVGHSMGGLLIRAYLKRYRPPNLGRVVMIGTPNGGSEIADFLKDFLPFKVLFGPAGQQLVTDQEKFRHIFCDVDFELGIIAGNKSIDPISSKIIGKPNDGKVSVESAFLEGAKDTIVLPSGHTFLTNSRQTWIQTRAFLEAGSFSR